MDLAKHQHVTVQHLQDAHESTIQLLVDEQFRREEQSLRPTLDIGPDMSVGLSEAQATAMLEHLAPDAAIGAVRTGYREADAASRTLDALTELDRRPDPVAEAWWPPEHTVPAGNGNTWLARAHEHGILTDEQVRDLGLLLGLGDGDLAYDHPIVARMRTQVHAHATAAAFAAVVALVEPSLSAPVHAADLPTPATDVAAWHERLRDIAGGGIADRLLRDIEGQDIGATAAARAQSYDWNWPPQALTDLAMNEVRREVDTLHEVFERWWQPGEVLDPHERWSSSVLDVTEAAEQWVSDVTQQSETSQTSGHDLDRLLGWYATVIAHRLGADPQASIPADLARIYDLALTVGLPASLPSGAHQQLREAASGAPLPTIMIRT